MTVALHRSWTQAEFFAWAEAQEARFEFDGVQPVAMVGGTNNHGALHVNIRTALRNRLRGGAFRPFV
jgi:hypothetical protein